MRMRVFCVCCGVIAGVLWQGAVCAAQSEPPSSVPSSLFVQDRFERAIENQSSAPYWLMATIVNDTTGETKRVCIEGIQLFEAVRLENKLGRGKQDWKTAKRLILENAARTYRFNNPDAWKQVQPRYSPEMLARVEQELRPLSTAELAARFSSATKGGFIKMDDSLPFKDVIGYCAVAAYVLTERGLLAGRGDFGNSLYVVTPQMLVEEDRREEEYAQKEQRREVEGRAFAARLPGYAAVIKHFKLNQPVLDEYSQGPCFSVTLHPISLRLVNSIDWLNPVKSQRKARYDWNQFLPIVGHVERLARQHPWLWKWRKVGPDRTIEARMYGRNLNSEFAGDVQKDIVPAWKDAGLSGKPYCQLILRWKEREEGANATLYLPLPGSGETRSLIVRSYWPRHDTVTGLGPHWLDRLPSFRSHAVARVRQVVVVTPGGDWKLLTLPTRWSPKP